MRRIAFIATFLGLFALLLMLNLSSPVIVSNSSSLSVLEVNSKVQTTGKVIAERQFEQTKILKLENGIEITCKSCPNYLNRTVSIEGIVNKYLNKTQIEALRVSPK